MPRFHKTTVVATAAAALVLVAQAAWASDVLDRDIYLRLGAGFSAFDDANFFDRDCTAINPPALFGCGDGPDNNPRGSYGEFELGFLMEVAEGLQVNEWLQVELAATYRPSIDFNGQSNFTGISLGTAPVVADLWNVSFMSNAHISLAPLIGSDTASWRPMLIGGVGLAINRTGSMEYRFNEYDRNDRRYVPPDTQFGLAWALGTGIEVDLTDRTSLQFLYRYSSLGKITTKVGNLVMTRDDRDDRFILIDETESTLDANEFLISMTYRY